MDNGTDIETRRRQAAKRALAEAEQRRLQQEQAGQESEAPKEVGRDGPDPARYGDWEKKGIVSDF